mgnify:CR=1 FL=1
MPLIPMGGKEHRALTKVLNEREVYGMRFPDDPALGESDVYIFVQVGRVVLIR